MPGNGKFPIKKMNETELCLIEPRPEAEVPAAAHRHVAIPGDGKGSGKKKDDTPPNILANPHGQVADTQLDETQETEVLDPTSPAPTIPGTPVPPSPAASLSTTTKAPRSSAKYDKYKDGSYWKILVQQYLVFKLGFIYLQVFL